MVKQQCLFGTLLSIKVPGRHFLFPESWRKGVKMTEPNRQSGESEERIIEIEIERLRPFKEHPFQVKDDKEMFLLQESIEKYGILNPLIVRPVPDGYYEIISGHRRKHAAEKLGYRKVPVIIRVLTPLGGTNRQVKRLLLRGHGEIPIKINPIGEQDAKRQYC